MLTFTYEFQETLSASPYGAFFPEERLFFDIETTGLSPKMHRVYLIGCLYRKDNRFILQQFFADSSDAEEEVLLSFCRLLEKFSGLISFNGQHFDQNFLQQRMHFYGEEEKKHFFSDHTSELEQGAERLSTLSHWDLFLLTRPFAKILGLENAKQKSWETFLGIHRKDLFSGGELISVYQDYLMTKKEEALTLLLLHNREDVLYMPKLLPLLAYPALFQGHFSVSSFTEHCYQNYTGKEERELLIHLIPQFPLPKGFTKIGETAGFMVTESNPDNPQEPSGTFHTPNTVITPDTVITPSTVITPDTVITPSTVTTPCTIILRIPLKEMTLKYFYSDFKDYYYLPKEDCAIHKSVAAYMDPAHRKKATASTCYTKKADTFLPYFQRKKKCPAEIIEPSQGISNPNLSVQPTLFYCQQPKGQSFVTLEEWKAIVAEEQGHAFLKEYVLSALEDLNFS